MYDIIVIGGGPAGLTAAIYGKRNGKNVLVIEKNVFGGQITNSPVVENIPGFGSISGDEFADKLLDQAIGQGVDVKLEEVASAEKSSDCFVVRTAEGCEYTGSALILATGTTHRLLGLDGEEELIGQGLSFCAVCDGDFYKDKRVVVIGGGNSAFVEANLLVKIAKELIMLQDLPFFTADAASQRQLFEHDNIETHVGTKIIGYEACNGRVCGVRYEENGEKKTIECDGVFLAIGLIPDNQIFRHLADLDSGGYFASDESCHTKTEGLFVAGDARAKSLRQVATACGDGAVAAIEACRYLDSVSVKSTGESSVKK